MKQNKKNMQISGPGIYVAYLEKKKKDKEITGDSDAPCIKNHCHSLPYLRRVKTFAEEDNVPLEKNYFMGLIRSIGCQYQLLTFKY